MVRGLGQAFGLSRAGFLQIGAVSDTWDIIMLGGSMVSYFFVKEVPVTVIASRRIHRWVWLTKLKVELWGYFLTLRCGLTKQDI